MSKPIEVQPNMTGQYYLDDLMEMQLSEIHQAMRNGQVSLEVFADYINSCMAIAGMIINKEKQ